MALLGLLLVLGAWFGRRRWPPGVGTTVETEIT
jgi:hypothetical protein